MQPKDILVINCGSSSLKFSLIAPLSREEKLSGLAQCLGNEDASITFKYQNKKVTVDIKEPFTHQEAITSLIQYLDENQLTKNIGAIGHRVVHGGEEYAAPTLINSDVLATLEKLSTLAPLHNPANITGIKAAQKAFVELPQVAVFDTAFHQTMPAKAFIYPLPYEFYQQHAIRKYGFHGTSHYYVAGQAAEKINKPIEQTNLITAHLGNGCSITAIKNGESIDTSMGFTPLAGFAMGTRSGDLDPGIMLHLINQLNYTPKQLDQILNKESGLKGISQLSNDCRTLEQAALEDNNPQAQLALDIFSYQIAKSISSLSASLTTLDAIVFTGGIGENSSYIREEIIKYLTLLNCTVEPEKNQQCRFGKAGNIAKSGSRDIWVIPTNEEWVIANQTQQLLESK